MRAVEEFGTVARAYVVGGKQVIRLVLCDDRLVHFDGLIAEIEY